MNICQYTSSTLLLQLYDVSKHALYNNAPWQPTAHSAHRALLCCYDSYWFCLQRIIIVYTEEGPRRTENFVNKNLVGNTDGVFETPSSYSYHRIDSPTRGNLQYEHIFLYRLGSSFSVKMRMIWVHARLPWNQLI